MSRTCSNCFYAKRIHPMQHYTDKIKHKPAGMKMLCMLTKGVVGEEFDACEEFKTFIGWAYR